MTKVEISQIKRLAVELTLSIMLVVTGADLLYLYIIGAWYDPKVGVEIGEVVCLVGFIFLGVGYSIWRVGREIIPEVEVREWLKS